MAEYRVPTQAELNRLLYMQGMQGKSNQQIIDENLARGSTIQSLPENFFQTASAGARRVGDYVNQAGNVQQIVNKLFPSNIGNSQRQVPIPTSFNFAPKQAPTGEIIPQGLQTQSVPVANILQAIKPADVLGISGAERAYGDIGAGKAPQPMDVVDTLGVGAVGLGATSGFLKATKGMPVGLNIKEVSGLLQTAPRSEIGFYSAVEQAALASPRKSATGQAFLNDIMKGQDVRADEIKWMGLDDYLKGKQNVTKQEVQDYIANNRVDVKEVQLGDTKFNKLSDEELINEYIRIRGYDPVSDGEALTRNEMLYELGGMNRTESGSTKFSQYTLPGGENYRELLLTMPAKPLTEAEARIVLGAAPNDKLSAADIAYASRKNVDEYKSSHFDQPNILAHLRVNDRIDADGKKMLLIEEVQSDWHQAGREKGYAGNLGPKISDEEYKRGLDLQNKYHRGDSLTYEEKAEMDYIMGRHYASIPAGKVPDAPFKDTWYQLALKRAIQHAAENGYDRIGLTTGSQQAARYDLSKQLSGVSYKDGRLQGYDKNGALVMNKFVEPNELPNYVGKDLGSKLAEAAKNDQETRVMLRQAIKNDLPEERIDELRNKLNNIKTDFSGLDLQVGGEGMKKYYDEIYPKFLDKYGKKWGAKIGETKVNTVMERAENSMIPTMGQEGVRYLDITPEMKAGVSKGQPLFAAVPAIPAAGLLAPQEQQRR